MEVILRNQMSIFLRPEKTKKINVNLFIICIHFEWSILLVGFYCMLPWSCKIVIVHAVRGILY